MADSLTLDPSGEPLPVRAPATVAELGKLVSETRAQKRGLYPVGGRTALDFGLPPIKPGVACDLTTLKGVIDYPARDMTITVRAGTTLAALRAELAREGQWLPIDVPSPEKSTLGGAVAVNACGPRRFGHGTLRDYVIGISFVTDDGAEVKAGGRVVKNVAGYDLMKLHIGALGTLGVVTQLTLKVKPKPEASAAVVFGCDSAALGGILDTLAASKTRPVAVELLNRAAWRATSVSDRGSEEPWTLVVAFEEKAAAVRWQTAALLNELKSAPLRDVTELPDAAVLEALTALQTRPASRCIGKVGILPSQVAGYVQDLQLAFPETLIHAHAMSGVVWKHGTEVNYDPATKTTDQRLAIERLVAWGANEIVRRAPAAVKDGQIWGRPAAATWELMRHVKKTLDPDNVFNPGRLFGDV